VVRTREPESPGPAWQVQAALIARRFYLQGQSKVEIGESLGLSRFKVARILDEAQERGLVEVRVHLPAPVDPDLSESVREHLGLHRAIVVEPTNGGAADGVRGEIGSVAAGVLTETVTAEDVLGLTCSRSVAATTAALQSLPPCPVVQLTGTLAGPDIESGGVESVRRAARVGGGKAYPVYAPMLLPDASTLRSLAGQSSVRQVLDRFGDVTVALVAVGGWSQDLSTVWETVTPRDRSRATKAGTVGEIGARLFDAHGTPVRTPIDERVLGVTLEQLRRVPEVIALARSGARAAAVRAAADGHLIDTLVCDADLGRTLLEQGPDETWRSA
jgi:DNA-binding transcriptional regulator LsrR (DeoR family)